MDDPQLDESIPPSLHRGTHVFLHSLFLTMAIVILLLSVFMSFEQGAVYWPASTIPMPSTCSSRIWLGIDCPGCGLTRAFICISQGQWSQAWMLNRVSFAVYLFVVAQIPWQGMQLWRLSQSRQPFHSELVYLVPITLACLLFFNWVLKLIFH